MWEAHNPWQAKFLNLASTLFNRKVSFRYQPKSQDCFIWGRMGRGVHLLYVVKMSTVPTNLPSAVISVNVMGNNKAEIRHVQA